MFAVPSTVLDVLGCTGVGVLCVIRHSRIRAFDQAADRVAREALAALDRRHSVCRRDGDRQLRGLSEHAPKRIRDRDVRRSDRTGALPGPSFESCRAALLRTDAGVNLAPGSQHETFVGCYGGSTAKRISVVDMDRCAGCRLCAFACTRREGFDPPTCTIPERILQTESPSELVSHELLREALEFFSRRLQ